MKEAEWSCDLRKLTEDIPTAKQLIMGFMDTFIQEAVPEGAPGQVYRVANRVALVAAAGELATLYGITRVIGQDALAVIG